MYETPFLVNTNVNSYEEYIKSLAKTGKKNHQYCVKNNQDLIYNKINYDPNLVSFFMNLWEDQLIRGEKRKWGFPSDYIHYLNNLGVIELFAAYLKTDNTVFSIHFVERYNDYVYCHPPLYDKNTSNKRYIAKYMWFNIIKHYISNDVHWVDFGAGNRELKRMTLYNDEIVQLEKEIGSKNYAKFKDQVDDAIKNIKSKEDIKKDLIIAKYDKPIEVGSGKGKSDLYDKAIPSFLKKYGKKWKAKVYEDEIDLGLAYGSEGTGKMPVTIIQLTDDMKKSVQTDGQALFSLFGLGVGADMVSDNIQNNIISQTTN